MVQQGVCLSQNTYSSSRLEVSGLGPPHLGRYLIHEYHSVGGQVIFLLMLNLQAVKSNGMFHKVRNKAGFFGEVQGFHALENASVSDGVLVSPGSAVLEFPWMMEMRVGLSHGWGREARSHVCINNHLFP